MATRVKPTESTSARYEALLAKGAGSGSGGSGDHGIGGGGGSPGGENPGGGGGGRPGGESVGNNLSFPAVFFGTAPTLRGDPNTFSFTTPATTDLDPAYRYFAQGVEGNSWQAGSRTASADQSVMVDCVDIGDALESAPLRTGTNVRLELTLYQDLLSPDAGEPVVDDGYLTGFAMTLLGGSKGGGKATVTGPTESQGARMLRDAWDGDSDHTWAIGDAPAGTTFQSRYASVYAAESTGGETADSYMSMAIQKVSGLVPGDEITGLAWNGSQWVDANPADTVTVGGNIVNTAFGPELNIAGKYIMGASGKPFKFTADGNYLITFALEDGTPVSFEGIEGVAQVQVANDGLPEELGFQPVDAEGRETQVIEDGAMSYGEDGADTHNGLLVMLIGIPSSASEGEA